MQRPNRTAQRNLLSKVNILPGALYYFDIVQLMLCCPFLKDFYHFRGRLYSCNLIHYMGHGNGKISWTCPNVQHLKTFLERLLVQEIPALFAASFGHFIFRMMCKPFGSTIPGFNHFFFCALSPLSHRGFMFCFFPQIDQKSVFAVGNCILIYLLFDR